MGKMMVQPFEMVVERDFKGTFVGISWRIWDALSEGKIGSDDK